MQKKVKLFLFPAIPVQQTDFIHFAQLEYARDYTYPQTIQMLDSFISFMESLSQEDNKSSAYIKDQLLYLLQFEESL